MKVTKQEVQSTQSKSHSHVAGKKLKNISHKADQITEISPNGEAVSASPHHQQKGAKLSKMKHVDVVNVVPSVNQQDSINLSSETPVLLSGDGILRQALLSFSYSGQEEKPLRNMTGKKSDSVTETQAIAVSDVKLSSSPGPLSPENVQVSFPSKALTHGTCQSKSLSPGTVLTGSLPLGNLPLVSLPPVSFTPGTFSHGTLPLMSLTSGPLPPVSEIPRPGNIHSLRCSASLSPRNIVSAVLPGPGIVTAMPTSFSGGSGNVPVLSEVPAYEVPQLGTNSLKVLVSLSSSDHRSTESHVLTQTSAHSKENSVTLVYSSIPKMEPSILDTSHHLSQKVTPLPPMSEMKSRCTSHLRALSHGKVNDSSSVSVNGHSDNGGGTICKVVPVSTDIMSVPDCTSRTSISVLSTPVSDGPTQGSNTNPIKLDESHDSTEELSQVGSVQNASVSHSLNFQTNSDSSSDLNHIVIPVSSSISSSKVDDHVLSSQDISQIITIPLTSSAIYGHSVGISIPITDNAVPLSMPVQVSSNMLPMSCSLIPVSSTTAGINPAPVPASETTGQVVPATGSVQSYLSTAVPSVSPNTAGTPVQQHSHFSSDISDLVRVTSSMALPISVANTMTSVTSASTTGVSGVMIPVTSSTDSIPVTSISVSVPSLSASNTTTTMVFATQNASVESVSTYAMQSPAEILSQLSKAGVLPTMSSSQVSSVLSALASDGCHLDLESESPHHVELMTQHQVMHLSSSADKVSTLTQTEDLELGHTVELGCNINIDSQHNKVIGVLNEIHLAEGDRLMEHHVHLLNHTNGRSDIVVASLPSSVSLAEKETSISNLPSTGSTQVSEENRVMRHQVDPRVIGSVGIDASAIKHTSSICRRTVSKFNLAPNDIITASLTERDIGSKLDMPKRGSELLTKPHRSDVNSEQRIVSVFIKQEDSENSLNLKVNNKAGGDGSRDNMTRKRKLQDVNDEKACNERTNTKCSKETKKQNIEDVELENYVEQVVCYKCKFCPFLTLEKKGVALHVQLVHGSQLTGNQQKSRHNIKCPGCKNVFFTSKSLRVHLSQDHQVGDEELRTLLEVVIRSSYKDVKAKNKFDKKRRKCIVKTHPPEMANERNDDKEMPDVTNSIMEVSCSPTPEVLIDECGKIRVRNLNSEALSELEETPASHSDITIANDVRDEDSLSSNGVSDGDVREGTLVIDDNPLIQQKRTKITLDDGCELKMIKTDTEHKAGSGTNSEIVVFFDAGNNSLGQKEQRQELKSNQGTYLSVKKKPGRPKGSKNFSDNGYRKLSSTQKEIMEKELGYRCDIDGCTVRLRSHDNIEYHRRCHHDEKFLCPECSQETAHWKSLSTHLWRYHVIDMELFACDQCSYKTNSYSKLMNLHHRIHGDERPFLCDTCGKGFKNQKQLRNHKAIHVAKQKQKTGPGGECDVCGRSFTNPRMLRVHKDNVHGKLRPHLCNFCGYSASSRSTLKMHMRLHTGEKPFHCDECEYATADHNSLRRHKMRHSGDKPYKCPHCSYACIQSSTYKAHLNTKHPGMETGLMFNCDSCSFRSVRKDNYLAHVAEHKNESYPTNRHRKHSLKPQSDSNKKTQERENPSRLEKSHLPTIINISHIITPVESGEGTLHENVESADDVQLIYNGSAVEGLLQQTSEMPLTPEFEAEQITGDIQDIKEPQELKFKIGEDVAS
ncbi:uncharacterized protein LOC110830826 isoform X3 [Zootermopsis nevadensis]|uniref:uncharacterized protein LOC110830826 isoform X3 n=1 Tax=Zootermopsis nevadensis TaxID=136037 RepID=UPI000B8E4DC0|nr:uncharacterized protein LOC110830826 isoform X3 [Zootermopsis nevadensis]